VQRISSDPFSNASSEHATEVEPSAAAFGSTVVAAFQTGRFFNQGASDLGTAASQDGGMTWQAATLPGTTPYSLPPGPYDSISDPSVAYDARHATWLVAALPVSFSSSGVPGAVVSRSPDGVTWSSPVAVTAPVYKSNDKSWIGCDNHPASPYYGHCYIEWDDANNGGLISMSTSTNGGITWSSPVHPAGSTGGIGGEPFVLANGTAVVLIDAFDGSSVLAFTSRDGGATWNAPMTVQSIADHLVAGGIREFPFVSAAQDAAGTIYAVWPDCRFRQGCASNDLVMVTSSDGTTWSAPFRIPIDPTNSSVDHFLPGVAVDAATSGSAAHIGILYYSYAQANCTPATCQLSANFVASPDGGATWTAPQLLVGPMSLQWVAPTHYGPMVGDYMAAVFANGRPIAVPSIAIPKNGAFFEQSMYAPNAGAISLRATLRRTAADYRAVPGARADHGPRHFIP
jgi:hypothetical protein